MDVKSELKVCKQMLYAFFNSETHDSRQTIDEVIDFFVKNDQAESEYRLDFHAFLYCEYDYFMRDSDTAMPNSENIIEAVNDFLIENIEQVYDEQYDNDDDTPLHLNGDYYQLGVLHLDADQKSLLATVKKISQPFLVADIQLREDK